MTLVNPYLGAAKIWGPFLKQGYIPLILKARLLLNLLLASAVTIKCTTEESIQQKL